MISVLKKALPAPFKGWLREAYRDRCFIRAVRNLRPGNVPAPDVLARLTAAWGNEGYSADLAYLRKVCECAAVTPGPVLECGSGLSTVLLAILAGQRGVKVYSLEHMAEWRNRLKRMLERCHLPAHVELCRLRPYDGFDWYELPQQLPDNFRLVICDGPPGSTQGGRYGLLPVCARRFAPECTILMDDAERPEDRAIANLWCDEFGLKVEFVQSGSGAFAEMRTLTAGG